MIQIHPKFKIGNLVWSRVGELQKGIVIDWNYQRRTNTIPIRLLSIQLLNQNGISKKN